MKFFINKKPSGDSLRVLNEEDIQKKLYGNYHKRQATSTYNKTSSYLPSTHSKSVLPRPQVNVNLKPIIDSVLKKVKTLPWKLILLVVGLGICVTLLFQFLSTSFKNLATYQQHKKEQVVAVVPVKTVEREAKKESPLSKAEQKAADDAASENEAKVLKKTYYAVQVCTYEKREDAAKLVAELKSARFSAFDLKMQAPGKPSYYVVFLGKEDSFVGANAKLKDFRRSEQYQKFPDAFIRSV